jgi:hypothetical protein
MDEDTGAAEKSRSGEDDCTVWKARATFYRAVIERYRDYIAEGEQKTIPLLKAMIDPKDASVQVIRSRAASAVMDSKKAAAGDAVVETRDLEYSFETDFDEAAAYAFASVQSLGKTHSELPISFWLSYSEMTSLDIADAFDRALFLCSILVSLGCRTAVVAVLLLDDGSTHPVVFLEYDSRNLLLDPCNKAQKFGEDAGQSKAELVAGFETADGKKAVRITYSFNHEEYMEYEEESG